MWSTEYLKSQGLCKSLENHQDALATKDTKTTKGLRPVPR
jgi:hypothetical protein